MSGQALFWSVHHWSIFHQIVIKTNPRIQDLTFGCIADHAGVNRLAYSKLGEPCDGNGNEEAEKHLDFDSFDVMKALV